MADQRRKYDVVIFGATGFTGQFVVEEVARSIAEEGDLTWAIAGRNMKKLQSALEVASKHTEKKLEDIPIIIADVSSEESLNEMAKQAKVVLNCVGPYRFFGPPVVRACVENGAHHLDISGEPQFLEKMQLLYRGKAAEAGVKVIGACGWDSIPADMGVTFTRDNFDGDLNSVESYVQTGSGPDGGGLHYATYQSAIHGFAHVRELPSLRKQLGLKPVPKSNHKLKKRNPVFYSSDVQRYCVPFPGSDKSVVSRTQRYNYESLQERPVQFIPYFCIPSLLATIGTVICGIIFGILANFSFGRTLLEKFPKVFTLGIASHEGPTRKQIAGSYFSMTFLGEGYSSKLNNIDEQHSEKPDKKIRVKVSGPEAGYISTPICMVQAAYTLLADKDKIPQEGGVFTPASVFAKTNLIERLNKHGIQFQVISSD